MNDLPEGHVYVARAYVEDLEAKVTVLEAENAKLKTRIENIGIAYNERKETEEAAERRVEALVDIVTESRSIIAAMVEWNKAVEKIIGNVPTTGFESANSTLAKLDAALKEARE
jgi:predicted ArsR family transcriptional regulator